MLKLAGITKRFGRRFPEVLGGVDLAAESGRVTAVLGRSGGGKTTLLRIVAGLETPTAGSVRVDGADWTRLEPERREVGLAFQALVVHPHLDVRGNVRLAAEAGGRRGATGRAAVDRALAATGLDGAGRPEQRAAELSGGQLQRLALARMLARRPRVCLLDEPMAHLDPPARLELRGLVRDLAAAADTDADGGGDGRIVVLVTHDRGEAMRLGDRMAVLAGPAGDDPAGGSTVHQAGPPAALAAEPATIAVADATGAEPINLVRGGRPGHWIGFRPEATGLTVADAGDDAGGPDGRRSATLRGRIDDVRPIPGGRLCSIVLAGEAHEPGEAGAAGDEPGRPVRVVLGGGGGGAGVEGDPREPAVGAAVVLRPATTWTFGADGVRIAAGTASQPG